MDWTVSGLQHVGIPTKDIDSTIRFYEGLGFKVAHQARGNANARIVFLRLGNLTVETYEKPAAVGTAGAVDHIALDVTDVEKAYEAAKAGGYKILQDGIQFMPLWENGVRFFIIFGPNEEKIEFNQKL